MNKEDYLAHHGVKGMRWGVRKAKVTKGIRKVASTTNPVNFVRDTYRKSDASAYKRSKTMSEADLKAANKRYQLEQQYRQNVRTDRLAGQNAVQRTLSKSGNIFTNAVIGAAAGAGGAYVGRKIFEKLKDLKV
jgi:hypothetical protein